MTSQIQTSAIKDMKDIDSIFTNDPVAYAQSYIEHLQFIMNNVDTADIGLFIQTLLDVREKNSTIFFIGNGGSAATASHFCNDLAYGVNDYEKPFRVHSLTDNVSVITALGNDYGYDEIFLRQLRVHGKQGDLLVGISASGNSANLIKTFKYAKLTGIKTFAITAFDGGLMKQIADEGIHVPTADKEYGPAEDVHMILDHLVSSYLMRFIRLPRK